jgi:hypothetical protein
MYGCDHYDRHIREAFFRAFEQADTVKIGHHQIGEHQFELLARGKQSQSLDPRTRLFPGVSGGGKDGADNLSDCLFVIDYENAVRHGCASILGDFNFYSKCRK